MKKRYIWRILTTPSCWLRNSKVSKAWDVRLNEMLDEPTFSKVDRYTVTLNGVSIWVENRFYAACSIYPEGDEFLPRRSTVFRFFDALERHTIDFYAKG